MTLITKDALLLVDIQNDYFSGGKMQLVRMEETAKVAGDVLKAFREANLPVFHIQHISTRAGATFFLPNTEGAEINNAVKPLSDEDVIIKHYPNSFRETLLDDVLKKCGVTRLYICGAMSHMCIDTTTRAAYDLGYNAVVVADACATKDLSFDGITVKADHVHASYMAGLNGIFADVKNYDVLYNP